MRNSTRTVTLLLTLLVALAGCDGATPSTPSPDPAPVPAPTAEPAAPTLTVFSDGKGFSTSDLRDAEDEIIQINSSNELIWTADGTRLPGYRVVGGGGGEYGAYFILGKICPEACQFEVRFGASGGEQRAYLTVDYGHDNPGTVVDVEVIDAALQVTPTSIYPPGTPTLSGQVTALTTQGPVPMEGVVVARSISTGWRSTRTDRSGFYEIPGLIDGSDSVYVEKEGFEKRTISNVVIAGHTRFDIELTAVPSP
jgi:hypothetical protein